MNETLKSACFEEITHSICDADKKVNISDVSNNWNISHRDSETLLLEWIEANKNQPLNREFLIRGIDKKGNGVIAVLGEYKLEAAKQSFEKLSYSLYSVELAGKTDVKRLCVSKLNDCKWINLRSKQGKRDIEEPVKSPLKESPKHVEPPSTSKKNIQSMFSNSKPKPEVKQEAEAVECKKEKETPKKQSPKKKEQVKAPKMVTGKSSISSFFSKSSAGQQIKKKEVDPPEPMEIVSSPNLFDESSDENKPSKKVVPKNEGKRPISDVHDDCSDEIPGTPQESKKPKKMSKEKGRSSRIVKMEDSSDEEDNREEQMKLLASPEKEKENKTPPKDEKPAGVKSVRRKGRKTVSRTFKDEEGYLVTKNEIVEYSCSEDDESAVPSTELSKPMEVTPASDNTQSDKKQTKKKPSPKVKQGSILSFFSKK